MNLNVGSTPSYSHRARFLVATTAGFLLGSHAMPAAAQDDVVVTASGRTVAVLADSRAGVLRIAVGDGPRGVKICNQETAIALGPIRLRYLVVPDVTSPRELAESEGVQVEQPTAGAFATGAVPRGSFVIYNISRAASPDAKASAVAECWAAIRTAKETQQEREDAVEAGAQTVRTTEALIATLKQRIESQRADAAAFGGRGQAADRIAEALARVEASRTALTRAETDLAAQRKQLLEDQAALAAAPDAIRDELGMSLSDAEYTVTMLSAGSLLKIGGILTTPARGVYYDFATYSARSQLQLMPMGDYPVVRYGERQFAVMTNVISGQHPFGFHLSSTAHDGAVVNTEPVRPTFEVAAGEAPLAAQLPARRTTTRAYTDIVLPIRGAFAPNQYPEVTISTERSADDDPKKRTAVTLVDKARYPQFRALYRYNFNTGVFASRLRGSSFTKVRVRDDDAATEDVDESLYRIQRIQSDGPMKPLFAFTYYLKPVDVQAPVSHERWIPNPTVGFAIASPAENIYFGFSHEILRNAQLFWGWHWGEATELVVRNDVSEERDGTAPPTREYRTPAFGVGLTFNVAVISKIFK